MAKSKLKYFTQICLQIWVVLQNPKNHKILVLAPLTYQETTNIESLSIQGILSAIQYNHLIFFPQAKRTTPCFPQLFVEKTQTKAVSYCCTYLLV